MHILYGVANGNEGASLHCKLLTEICKGVYYNTFFIAVKLVILTYRLDL